jgi:hypothetical protein
VEDPSSIASLSLALIRDDGAVVYVNGVEVARSNMPTGPITRTTLASAAVDGVAETTPHEFTVEPSTVLVPGTNVVAVEVCAPACSAPCDGWSDSSCMSGLPLAGWVGVQHSRGWLAPRGWSWARELGSRARAVWFLWSGSSGAQLPGHVFRPAHAAYLDG